MSLELLKFQNVSRSEYLELKTNSTCVLVLLCDIINCLASGYMYPSDFISTYTNPFAIVFAEHKNLLAVLRTKSKTFAVSPFFWNAIPPSIRNVPLFQI